MNRWVMRDSTGYFTLEGHVPEQKRAHVFTDRDVLRAWVRGRRTAKRGDTTARGLLLVKRPASSIVNVLVRAHNIYAANKPMCWPRSAILYCAPGSIDCPEFIEAMSLFDRARGGDHIDRASDLEAFRRAIALGRHKADAAARAA